MTVPDPPDAGVARRVLTDTQYLTWYMRSTGVSQQAIAYYRGVSREAVRDCLARVETRMKAAKEGDVSEAEIRLADGSDVLVRTTAESVILVMPGHAYELEIEDALRIGEAITNAAKDPKD